ncbi:MAG TPA: thiamine phosphate synthase [Terriglobia bacterium]|jgi:thiamine-phosphate pyrophosphorylase
MTPLPRLYAIADSSFGDCVRIAEALFTGGARLVQIRNKKAGARELLDQVEQIVALAPPDAAVIVNDRVDVALLSGAAGVHLGQSDLPPAAARRILGPDRIIGISTHNLEQAIDADGLPVDYIAAGPLFATSTKENPDPVLGVEALAQICGAIRKPVVAVGGITLARVPEVVGAGAHSVAIIKDLLGHGEISSRVRDGLRCLT